MVYVIHEKLVIYDVKHIDKLIKYLCFKRQDNFSVHALLHKEKSVYFTKEMDEVRAMKKIEVKLSQEKINFINYTYQKELEYWKKVASESI